MARRKKRLVDLVRDGTFLARKDDRLLLGRESLPWPALEAFRLDFQAAPPGKGRREIALHLEHELQLPDAQRRLFGDLQRELAKLGPRGSWRRLERFAPRFFSHRAGPSAGQPFVWDPYQRRFLREWTRHDARGERIYTVSVLGIPKGNGKTPLAAVLGTLAVVENVDAPEVYVVAGAKDQAEICHDFASVNIQDGALAAWLEVAGSSIVCAEHDGEFEVLSSAGDLGHGTIPTLFIVDEWWLFMHRQQREAYNAGAKALHKRPGVAALLAITTAGYDLTSQLGETFQAAMDHPLLEVREKGRGPLYVVKDEEAGFFFEWYGAPDDADIENPAVIRKANPLSVVRPEDLLRELARPDTDELDWRRLHLNQWTKTKRAWLSSGVWAGLRSSTQIPEGAVISIGIDAAHSHDTSSVSWAWRTPEGKVVTRSHIWSVRPNVPHHTLVDGGRLNNEELLEPFIHELAARYRVHAIGFDPRYFVAEAFHLAAAGFEMVEVYPQGGKMAEAVTAFEQRVLRGLLEHDGDRAVQAHLDAIDVITNPGGGKKIGKRSDAYPIDAGISNILASFLAETAPEQLEETVELWAEVWR